MSNQPSAFSLLHPLLNIQQETQKSLTTPHTKMVKNIIKNIDNFTVILRQQVKLSISKYQTNTLKTKQSKKARILKKNATQKQ